MSALSKLQPKAVFSYFERLCSVPHGSGNTKQISDLQAEWKKIGFAPQKMNTAIFERFRKGCDAFFGQKAQFFQNMKEELNSNLAKKKELVEKAEALTDSTDWKESDGKFYYNTNIEGEFLGDVVDPFSEIKVTEDGCLLYSFDMLLMERA